MTKTEIKKFSTIQYLIAVLKEYGIKNAVVSPGRQNSYFNSIIQENEFFNVYSIVDERSAAYVATGISFETQKPTILTCTGATASRNYLSALTEAYYRKIPIIAITFYDYSYNKFTLHPQFVDRSVSQNDIKYESVELPPIKNKEDITRCLTLINGALSTCAHKKLPIHINCPSSFNYADNELPTDIWCTKYYEENFTDLKSELKNKDFAIFIGSHDRFNKKTADAISKFAKSWDIPVFCDHTSGYSGDNKVLISKGAGMIKPKKLPEIVIDLGSICGDYHLANIFKKAQIWRVSENGEFKNRLSKPLTKLFNCFEYKFFEELTKDERLDDGYYTSLKSQIDKIKLPELPLCNAYICNKLSKLLPKNSSLHLAILNSLRHMDYFDLDASISVNSNVGGFGIDGPISTLLGQALISQNKLVFGLTGDLAFFYDMNAIGYRDIPNNIRIILVNNNRGEEFRLNTQMELHLGNKTDKFIAAAGHYKNGAKAWAESCEFHYMSANNIESFDSQINEFCNGDFGKPVLFEVFTTVEDEQKGFKLMTSFNKPTPKKVGFFKKLKMSIKGKLKLK